MIKKWKDFIRKVFKKDGKPYEATDGQVEIFEKILNPYIKNLWITAPSRYGKTEISALAILTLASQFNLKIPIVGGSYDKANKIMEYILEHIGDNYYIYEGLINLDLKEVESLKVQRSKVALRWKNGGWIYITSIDERNISKEGSRVVGEGGDMVFLEEAGLIKSEEQFSKVVRMPEGKIAKLVMSGNCFENSIFEKAYHSDIYHKVKITLDQAIKEGRIDKERLFKVIKPQMTRKDWLRFYETKFPKSDDFSYFKPKKYEILPRLEEMEIFGAIDLSLGEKGSNLTGIVILGKEKKTGKIYEVESIGQVLKPDEAINRILSFPYNFVRFGIEDVYFQRYFKNVIEEKSRRLGKFIPFTGIKQSKSKIERIESLEPIVNTAQIEFKGGNELFNELKNYPELEFIDVLDALEMCYRLIKENQVLIYQL